MLAGFFLRREWALWAWGGFFLLLATVGLQVHLLVLLNDWYELFYDLLQNAKTHDIDEFWQALATGPWRSCFLKILAVYVVLASFSSFFARHYTFRWRQAITQGYLHRWCAADRDVEGSSQRIQEDTQKFARIVGDLGLEFFESILKVLAFISVLWRLSDYVTLDMLKDIPGSLVWVALLLSVGGMAVSFLVGSRLPGLEYNNQRVEARFRKQLVYAEDDKRYADVATLMELFTGVRLSYFRLFLHYGYFDLWRIFYLQFTAIVPYLLMGPSLFLGTITLGILAQTGNAFGKVVESFSYFIRSWTMITELLSVIRRLREFEDSIALRRAGEAREALADHA
jgi:peptide/bleomycin uptake transporter